MDYGRGPWELVMVRTTRQMPLKLCSDYSLPIWRRTRDRKKRVFPPFAFFHYATFFWSSNFFTFSKSIRGKAYTISLRTGSPFWWKWGLKSRGEGEGKNGMGSFRCTPPPPSPPSQLHFLSLLIFFFPTPLWSLIPCQANTVFRRHERIYAKHCWLVVLVHVKLTLSACFNSCHLPTTFRYFKWRLTAFIMYVIWW